MVSCVVAGWAESRCRCGRGGWARAMHHIVRTAVLEPYPRSIHAAEGIPSQCDWMAGLAGMALKQVLGQMMMLGWAVMNASMLEANMNAVSRCVECARPTRSTSN